jgi:hypothetical protein
MLPLNLYFFKFITQHKYITFKERVINLWQHAHSSPTIHQEILDWFSWISIHPRKTKQTWKEKFDSIFVLNLLRIVHTYLKYPHRCIIHIPPNVAQHNTYTTQNLQASKARKHKQMLSTIETKFTITTLSPITCKKLNTNKMHNKKTTWLLIPITINFWKFVTF